LIKKKTKGLRMKTSRSGKQKSIFAALRLADLVLEFSLGR